MYMYVDMYVAAYVAYDTINATHWQQQRFENCNDSNKS